MDTNKSIYKINVVNRISNKNVCSVNQGLEEIKYRWLNKLISIDELTHELIQYNEMTISFQSKKEVLCLIRNKLLSDANVESSYKKISNILFAFVPIMISIIALVASILKPDIATTVILGIVVVILIGLGFFVFPIINKHAGNYCRKKTFYQVVLEIMDNETNTCSNND